jgi:hypothetical protein
MITRRNYRSNFIMVIVEVFLVLLVVLAGASSGGSVACAVSSQQCPAGVGWQGSSELCDPRPHCRPHPGRNIQQREN